MSTNCNIEEGLRLFCTDLGGKIVENVDVIVVGEIRGENFL